MISVCSLLRGFMVLLLGLLLSSCSVICKPGPEKCIPEPAPVPEKKEAVKKEAVRKEAMPSDAEGFSAEIARMKVIGAQHNDVAVRAKAHLQLARLYSDYRNPEPNYFNALQELETHIDLDPGGRGNDEIQNWLAMLRELARYESESRRKERNIETLKKENKAAKDHVDQLEKKNREMKDLIDKLQSIDIQIEERRRSIK